MIKIRKYIAEMFGTMILVAFGCGLASTSDNILIIALAFGLSLMIAVYIFGPISGGHFNPAVSIANMFLGDIGLKDTILYMLFQIIGAFLGVFILYLILGSDISYGTNFIKPGHTLMQGILFELIFSFIFVLTVLGVTSKNTYKPVAGIVIGGALMLIHLLGIPITGTSLNPARSVAPAIFSGNITAISELWIFIIMPILGGVLATIVWEVIFSTKAK